MLKRIINHLVLRSNDVVILDMEAGLEHLGRGTAENMDQFVVVIEPGARSVQTYKKVKTLATDLGVKQVRVVANKVRGPEDESISVSKSLWKIFWASFITVPASLMRIAEASLPSTTTKTP